MTESQRAKVLSSNLLKAPANKFYKPLRGSNQLIRSCIDGRSPDEPGDLTANGAGASLGLYFMVLGTGTMSSPASFSEQMNRANLPLGAHDDDQQRDTGCGANDRFLDILQKMQEARGFISGLRQGLGYKETTTDYDYVSTIYEFMSPDDGKSAGQLAQDRLAAIKRESGPESITHLKDQHGEVAVIWNSAQDQSTLDRVAVSELVQQADLTRDNKLEMEVFNVDAWAFEQTAIKTLQAQYGAKFDNEGQLVENPAVVGKPTDHEIQQAIDFLIDYNLATTLVLGNGNLDILHRY